MAAKGDAMPSPKSVSAVRIARSLTPAELAVNEAAIGVLVVGAEVLRARTSGGFAAIEGQAAVDSIGRATSMIFGALAEISNAHMSLREVAAEHDILGYGDLCPPPSAEHDAVGTAGLRAVA